MPAPESRVSPEDVRRTSDYLGPTPESPRALIRLSSEQAEAHRAALVDPSRRSDERVSAWKTLQLAQRATPENTQTIAGLLRSSPDARTRESICRMFRGDPSDLVRAALAERLRCDPSERVRQQAALSLVSISRDPVAREALDWARRNDASAAVQAVARLGFLEDGVR